MWGRYATATELADETTARVLQRMAGLGLDRHTAWDLEFDVAVFNPTPVARTDVVRLPLDGFPLFRISYDDVAVHPWSLASASLEGYEANGKPIRVVRSDDAGRVRIVEDCPPLELEFVVEEVPAFGWQRIHLTPSRAHDDRVDDGPSISNGKLTLTVEDDGTFALSSASRTVRGIGGVEDLGDRGDTYDFDPLPFDPGARFDRMSVERRRHPSGIERIAVTRVFLVPEVVEPDRRRRSNATVPLELTLVAAVAPGIDRIDLRACVASTARDHRLRLLFPSGSPATVFHAASTFDVAQRDAGSDIADGQWWHRAPRTFPHQGWVSVNGLTVGAPGLPEAEVTEEGVIAITLLRAVGWLSHLELTTRPIPAGPTLVTPDAQCAGGISAELTLRLNGAGGAQDLGAVASAMGADELGLRAVAAGPHPLLPAGRALLGVTPPTLVLSALKPAEDGKGVILRVLNPTSTPIDGTVTLGFDVEDAESVRLDESADGGVLDHAGSRIDLTVAPHHLRSIRLRLAGAR